VSPEASQVGRQFEALARLECQLRLNGYKTEAGNLGFAIRTDMNDIHTELGRAGVALGLFSSEYRRVSARGFAQ
jgi:hypothetical protein